jgi:multidrug efflux system membrane fusion protein
MDRDTCSGTVQADCEKKPRHATRPTARLLLSSIVPIMRLSFGLAILVLSAAGCGGSGSKSVAAAAEAGRVIPVLSAPVAKKDVPIYLEGLGNVIAYKTVTVKTQVDGRLDKVLFKEGQAVKAGDVLAQVDPRPFQIQLHQAEGALSRDQAQLRDNSKNLERYEQLRDQKLVAQQQVDDQRASVGQFEGAVHVDQAAIDSARLNLTWARITSPIDGVTGVRLVDPGNVVHAADQGGIVVVTQLDPIAILFTLPEDELPRVQKALAGGEVTVEAWSRDGATKLGTGTVELIDNQINQTTATIRLKAIFKNPQRLLWPNQFVKARLLLMMRAGALVVPQVAIQRGPQGMFVYVIGSDSTVSPRPVEVETQAGDQALIAKGLNVGDQVVTDGQNQLRPGSRVQSRQPAAPQQLQQTKP